MLWLPILNVQTNIQELEESVVSNMGFLNSYNSRKAIFGIDIGYFEFVCFTSIKKNSEDSYSNIIK